MARFTRSLVWRICSGSDGGGAPPVECGCGVGVVVSLGCAVGLGVGGCPERCHVMFPPLGCVAACVVCRGGVSDAVGIRLPCCKR